MDNEIGKVIDQLGKFMQLMNQLIEFVGRLDLRVAALEAARRAQATPAPVRETITIPLHITNEIAQPPRRSETEVVRDSAGRITHTVRTELDA